MLILWFFLTSLAIASSPEPTRSPSPSVSPLIRRDQPTYQFFDRVSRIGADKDQLLVYFEKHAAVYRISLKDPTTVDLREIIREVEKTHTRVQVFATERELEIVKLIPEPGLSPSPSPSPKR